MKLNEIFSIYEIVSVDFKSIYKSIWLFSRILIAWSFFPDTWELTEFAISYYPDGETPKFEWGWDKWFGLTKK